jgi:Na+-translocating ferredoxin:NAD+ oxidoreductase subunit B
VLLDKNAGKINIFRGGCVANDIYRTLRERLDTYSLGFPATESGVEIEILKRFFTEEEAELFLALSPFLDTPEAIAQRLGKPVSLLAGKLEDMASRGLLFRLKKADVSKYSAIPFMHGLMEFQIGKLDRELALLLERYYASGFVKAIAASAETFLRPIPIHETIDALQQVAPFDDAREILRNTKLIVVAPCICRKSRDLTEDSCGKPQEACFMFGSMGQYYLDNGLGRQVTADEAVDILEQCHEAGLVTQPSTAQNPAGMCNCCGDCCYVLKTLKAMPRPADLVLSNYFITVDAGECIGCGVCMDRCQMEAFRMGDRDVAEADLSRCIGCGLCVTTCPTGCLSLSRKPEGECRTPPATAGEQMIVMARKRGFPV